jgi:hypothetical protein
VIILPSVRKGLLGRRTAAAVSSWILAMGSWDDAGTWDEFALWND